MAPSDPSSNGRDAAQREKDRAESERRSTAREYGRASSAAWEFAGAIVLCTLAGLWLDRKFGTTPWITIGGALLGFVAGFTALVVRLGVLGGTPGKPGERPDDSHDRTRRGGGHEQ